MISILPFVNEHKSCVNKLPRVPSSSREYLARCSSEVSQSSRVEGSKGLEINSLVIPITYAIRSLFATTSYIRRALLVAGSLSSPPPFSNNAPLPGTLLAIRRFTSASMNARAELRVWTSNPVHKWILLPFQLRDKSKLLFVGRIWSRACLELLHRVNCCV